MNLGVPQGSRMSPLLFLCLMADMDLWTEKSLLANFADDTQTIVINNNLEKALNITSKEANNIILSHPTYVNIIIFGICSHILWQ